MDTKSIVPRLENLAYTASFKEILSNLALCRDHRPSNELETVNYSSFMSTMATSEKLITFVRNRLDYHLAGLMSDKMRKKFVQQFYETFCKLEENAIEPWVFLECVLDDSFQELEIHAALPGAEPDSRLISTIANCSSELKKLRIDFTLMKNLPSVRKMIPLVTSLSSLENLTRLNLYQMQESHRSVLKLIGNSCPLLTHLSISGFFARENDYLSLILGEFVHQLFPVNGESNVWSEDWSSLEFLQAPSEILTPFCFTLRYLQLDMDVDTDEFYCFAGFVLRHLPSLEKMNGFPTIYGVEQLQYSTVSPNEAEKGKIDKQVVAEQFKNACKVLAAFRPSAFENRPTFTGSLSLVNLDCVYLESSMLQAVPKFCPLLKEVTFCMSPLQLIFTMDGRRLTVRWALRRLKEHFKDWPKLETITFVNIRSGNVEAILEAFSSSLKHVTFRSCKKINLMNLISCCQLESLSILGFSNLEIPEIEPGRPPPEFILPALKSFQSDYCLSGLWSLWLEQQSQLTHVALNCCHNGTKTSHRLDFSRIPKMWPNLESLKLRRCDELTMTMLATIVPQLGRLKELHLPEIVAQSDPKLAAQMCEDLSNRPSPVHLSFTKDP